MELNETQNEKLIEEVVHKKRRQRKKQLYNSILSQMEFYFSDSNLNKDRFLSQLIQDDSSVDLTIFLSFNKIRKLTTNIEDVQKAISKSNLIELTEDKTKVFRKTPISNKTNIDECTIYVERIKADTTHDWLKKIFSEFGNVVYVSIPKYKQNRANKGFAFIEYNTENEAKQALNYFESIGHKMVSDLNPEELCSITSYKNEEDNVTNKRKCLDEDDNDCNSINKKIKLNEEIVDDSEEKVEHNLAKQKKELKRQNYIKELGLQVLSKKEWKKIRNRYLNLQWQKMKEFKQHLKKNKPDKFKKPLTENSEQLKQLIEENPPTKLEFIPGVIVKILLNEECDEKKLKCDIKALSHDHVKFVDIPLPAGNTEVFVRFDTSDSAKEFCTQETLPGKLILLKDEEEKTYWKKIENDRITKFNKVAKKQRGRDKLLKKAAKEAAKHIRFDD